MSKTIADTELGPMTDDGVSDPVTIARDQVYEFAFVGASLKLRGASGALMRPLAFPLRRK